VLIMSLILLRWAHSGAGGDQPTCQKRCERDDHAGDRALRLQVDQAVLLSRSVRLTPPTVRIRLGPSSCMTSSMDVPRRPTTTEGLRHRRQASEQHHRDAGAGVDTIWWHTSPQWQQLELEVKAGDRLQEGSRSSWGQGLRREVSE